MCIQFCVIDDVIPKDDVSSVCDEVRAAPGKAGANREALDDSDGAEGISRTGRLKHPSAPVCDLVWMPEFTSHLAHPAVCAVARALLDDHIRISQFNFRAIAAKCPEELEKQMMENVGSDQKDKREWHTDWPHDLSAYGAGEGNFEGGQVIFQWKNPDFLLENPDFLLKNDDFTILQRNAGCIRQPFPDICMCLTMIHYLTDGDETSGGTWIVPGSHRDARNPRGLHDGMNVSAPIPGEMQVTAPAGSVFIQDTRAWHCSAMYNPGRDRIPIVSRWCPWWLSVHDFGGSNLGYLGLEEYEYVQFTVQMLIFVFKTRNFVLKTRNCALNTRNCAFKMMNFAVLCRRMPNRSWLTSARTSRTERSR